MPTKEELLKTIEDRNYSYSEVKNLISSTCIKPLSPNKIKKGDIIVSGYGIAGKKSRPLVVIKVLKDTVITISLTTTKDYQAIYQLKNRFIPKQYVGKALNTCTIEFAKDNYIGTIEDKTGLNKAIKLIKEYINNI